MHKPNFINYFYYYYYYYLLFYIVFQEIDPERQDTGAGGDYDDNLKVNHQDVSVFFLFNVLYTVCILYNEFLLLCIYI